MDTIYVRTGAGEAAVDIFEVVDIRCLGDSRSVIRGFCYSHQLDFRKNYLNSTLHTCNKLEMVIGSNGYSALDPRQYVIYADEPQVSHARDAEQRCI